MPLTQTSPAPRNGDAEIIRLLRERDPAGLRTLLGEHGAIVRAGLRKCLGGLLNDSELDDVINRAAFKAWRAADSYDPSKGTLRAWFFVIARNAGRGLLRDPQRARVVARDDMDQLAVLDEVDHADRDHGAGSAAPPPGFLDTLRLCIDRLPNKQRRIIQADLRTGDVADADELARSLGTSKNSIYALRSIARKRLRQDLQELGYTPGGERS